MSATFEKKFYGIQRKCTHSSEPGKRRSEDDLSQAAVKGTGGMYL